MSAGNVQTRALSRVPSIRISEEGHRSRTGSFKRGMYKARSFRNTLMEEVVRPGSMSEVAAVKTSSRLLLLHTSLAYSVWHNVTLLGTLATLLALPLELAFYSSNSVMTGFRLCLDILFGIDILINFRLSYPDPLSGEPVVDGAKVARRYALSNLLPDIISIFPFGSLAPDVRWLELFGFCRFFRMRRMLAFFGRFEQSEWLPYDVACLSKFVFLIVLNLHTAGCIMWFLASLRGFDPERTWLDHEQAELAVSRQYVTCVYWAVTTLTTVGYGDYSPVSIEERLVGCVYMVINLGVAAYIIGTVTMLTTKGDDARAGYREQLKQLKKFARANKLPPALHRTMKQYIGLGLPTGISSHYVDASFEASLPPFLQARIRNVRHRPLLTSIPLLAGEAHLTAVASDVERVASLHFLAALISRLTEVVLMDGVRVFEPHDVVQEIWIVMEGNAEGLVPDSSGTERTVLRYRAGSLLGAASFFSGVPMPWAVQITSRMRALKLTEHARDMLFEAYPEQGRRIMVDLVVEQRKLVDLSNRVLAEAKAAAAPADASDATKGGSSCRFSFTSAVGCSSPMPRRSSANKNDVCASAPPSAKRVSRRSTLSRRASTMVPTSLHNSNLRLPTGKMENAALATFVELCSGLLASLEAQKIRRDHALAATLCDFAAKNMVVQLRKAVRALDVRNLPPDYDGRTALHLAAANGHKEVIEILVDQGVDPSPTDRFGRTPLFEAALNRQTACVALLRARGATLQMPRLQQAVELCQTVVKSDAPVLEALLSAGMDAAAADYDGRTALHLACGEGNFAIVKLLLAARASGSVDIVGAKDRWGRTPLDDAKEKGHGSIIKALEPLEPH